MIYVFETIYVLKSFCKAYSALQKRPESASFTSRKRLTQIARQFSFPKIKTIEAIYALSFLSVFCFSCLSFFNFRSRSRLLLYNNTLLNIYQYLCLKNPKRFSALSSIYNAFVRFRFRGRQLCLHVFIDLLRRSLETAYLLYEERHVLSIDILQFL